jgi:hypothetical protein
MLKRAAIRSVLGAAFLLLAALAGGPFRPVRQISADQGNPAEAGRTWMLADFDGDRLPELATAHREGRAYRVDIQLSGTHERASFILSSGTLGIRIFAADVDRDQDRDLVIADSDALARHVVWLNDGHGHFRRDERRSYTHLLDGNLTSSFSPNRDTAGTAAALATERAPDGAVASSALPLALGARGLLDGEPAPSPRRLPAHAADARAPPIA